MLNHSYLEGGSKEYILYCIVYMYVTIVKVVV